MGWGEEIISTGRSEKDVLVRWEALSKVSSDRCLRGWVHHERLGRRKGPAHRVVTGWLLVGSVQAHSRSDRPPRPFDFASPATQWRHFAIGDV